jgi:hypothetical protein
VAALRAENSGSGIALVVKIKRLMPVRELPAGENHASLARLLNDPVRRLVVND